MRAKVTVYPRREILDPQGKAIRTALQRVGFAEVTEVRAGKSFEIDLGPVEPQAAADRVAAMCEQLLANTVVEEYAIEVLGEAPADAERSGRTKA
jgi:phosphoribosylformylglycinamidine synthase